MEESNINVVLIIASLLAGTGIGALGYHLLGSGARQVQQLRQRLAEKERQLSEVRIGLGDHIERLAAKAQALSRDSEALLRDVNHAGTSLGVESRPGLDVSAAPISDDTGLAMPRDYAAGNSGTLSEDFGLKGDAKKAAAAPDRR
ncbi:MAG TPA: DUF1043 family protein [Halomonas sp.]|nr:DUF1043 family protein [Halomonas sp.]